MYLPLKHTFMIERLLSFLGSIIFSVGKKNESIPQLEIFGGIAAPCSHVKDSMRITKRLGFV